MKSKLAGRLSLQDMISAQLETAREKLAAAEPEAEKVKKLVEYEKSYHGHVPSPKEEMEEKKKALKEGVKAEKEAEEAAEKKAAAEEVEKLASALDYVGELLKEADAIENGGEYKGGGEQLPVATPVGGKQPYKHDAAKRWASVLPAGETKASDAPAATSMPTNEHKAPGGAAYPAKGVLKTASKTKKSSAAVDFILNKIAEYHGGGETLDDQAAPVPANAGRELIGSNEAVRNATKKQAKSPRKAELSQVLAEPAMSAASDSKVNENLRSAPQAGVKIAAAKALLQKIAEEGCSCNGKKECRYCKMQAVLEKKKEEKKAE